MVMLKRGVPRIVDPEARRTAVVDALFRVVRREGVEQASLRNVAEEAGLAIGSVRHYFDGHDELIIFAAQELHRRISDRVWARAEQILAAPEATDRRRLSAALLAEWLPLDEN